MLQMSITGGILVLIIAVIRRVAIHRLPKQTFLLLWGIALFSLLIPISVPLPFVTRTAISSTVTAPNDDSLSASVLHAPSILFSRPVTLPIQQAVYVRQPAPVDNVRALGQMPVFLWVIGAMALGIFFVVIHRRYRKIYATATPVENEYVNRWLRSQNMRRSVYIRCSDRVTSPLTYGILKPVILFPKSTDWQDKAGLQYVLVHELTHIRRFDVVLKWVLTIALCVHWFNPLVWLMYVLANRDIELACDEAVIKAHGESVKSDYALTLIRLEEKKANFYPLYASFAQKATQERILSIMKTKKITVLRAAATVLLVVTLALGALVINAGSPEYHPTEITASQESYEYDEPATGQETYGYPAEAHSQYATDAYSALAAENCYHVAPNWGTPYYHYFMVAVTLPATTEPLCLNHVDFDIIDAVFDRIMIYGATDDLLSGLETEFNVIIWVICVSNFTWRTWRTQLEVPAFYTNLVSNGCYDCELHISRMHWTATDTPYIVNLCDTTSHQFSRVIVTTWNCSQGCPLTDESQVHVERRFFNSLALPGSELYHYFQLTTRYRLSW